MSTAVTVKGQVTLPKDVRDKVGIKPGDRVEVRAMAAGTVIIEKVKDTALTRIEKALEDLRRRGIVATMSANEVVALTRRVE